MSFQSSQKFRQLDQSYNKGSSYLDQSYSSDNANQYSNDSSQKNYENINERSLKSDNRNQASPFNQYNHRPNNLSQQQYIKYPQRGNNNYNSGSDNNTIPPPIAQYPQAQRKTIYGVQPLPLDSIIRRYSPQHITTVVRRNIQAFPQKDKQQYSKRTIKLFASGMMTLNLYSLIIYYEFTNRNKVWHRLTKNPKTSLYYFIPSICFALYSRSCNRDLSLMVLNNRELVEKLLIQEDYLRQPNNSQPY